MKILKFDSVGGASGDMILGALLGLGVDRAALVRDLRALGAEHFDIALQPFQSHGITGVQAAVTAEEPHHHHDHDHHHDHGHGHHHGEDAHGSAGRLAVPDEAAASLSGRANRPGEPHHHDDHHHHHHAPHRGLKEITAMVQAAGLPAAVQQASLAVFQRIAEAEAKIHGTTPDRIHFHEVGALDSIVDVVGGCLALHRLGVEQVVVGPLPLGHGLIQCAHGTYPSPAPATVELLKGAAVCEVDEPFETVTPTGAALLTSWRNADAVPAGARVVEVAYSFGHRRLQGRPNVLRATLLEYAAPLAAPPGACLVLECNLDDTTPELIGALTGRLLEAGALDVYTTPIQMKKQRPGVLLGVLCEPAARAVLLDLIFRGCTTFGVREYPVTRTVLARRHETVQTPYGPVRVKIGTWNGDDVTRAPEFEDCAQAAKAHEVSVRAVYEAALRA